MKVDPWNGSYAQDGFLKARSMIAKARPGIGNLHLFSMEEGVLSDIGWVKIQDVVLTEA